MVLKKNLGTDSCIYLLKEVISVFSKANTSVFLGFLDASKAFDRINHGKLFSKLLQCGVPMYIVRILSFWYKNQSMYVRWGGTLSHSFKCSNGVKQGGILSPYLFNLYMDGLSKRLNAHKVGCCIGGHIVGHLMYADDLVLISPSVKGLQKLLLTCELYGTENDIMFNSLKSKIMIVRSRAFKDVKFPDFKLNQASLDEVFNYKYLGHILSNDCSDDSDIIRHCRFLYAVGNGLIRNFYMCSHSVKLKLFSSYCCNIYAGQLWFNYKSGSMNKVRVAYNSMLRCFLGIPRFENGVNYSASAMFVYNNIISFPALVRKLIYRFQLRLSVSGNRVLNYISTSRFSFISKIWMHWRKMLQPP